MSWQALNILKKEVENRTVTIECSLNDYFVTFEENDITISYGSYTTKKKAVENGEKFLRREE